jgi:hypothetical protein
MSHKLSAIWQSEEKEEMRVIQCPVDGQKRQHYVVEPSKSVCDCGKGDPGIPHRDAEVKDRTRCNEPNKVSLSLGSRQALEEAICPVREWNRPAEQNYPIDVNQNVREDSEGCHATRSQSDKSEGKISFEKIEQQASKREPNDTN